MFDNVMLVDGNHLAYRAYYKFLNLRTLDGMKTGMLYGVPYILESLIRKFAPDKTIVVFDGGKSKFRLNLLPNYKERKKSLDFDSEDFHRQKKDVVDLVIALGITTYMLPHVEADDIITDLALHYKNLNQEIIIVSGDKDFNQLIGRQISIYNVNKKITIDKFNCKDITGLKALYWVDYLCLTGDDSDNIPGYPGIGPKRGIKFLEKFRSIRRFLNSNENFSNIDKEKLSKIYWLNRQLIDLRFFAKEHLGTIFPLNSIPKYDDEAFSRLCRYYQMNSLTKPQFINTFKNVKQI